MDDDLRYRAVQSRDPRFDGVFFVGVTSTGIYCRPSCASVMPGRARVRFFPSAAAAQRAGFRACKRCRPDASPGSPEWNRRGDVVGRAMRAIGDGVVDRDGVSGLAAQLGYSARQLNRLLVAELGAGPIELARAQRAQTARILLETTSLRIAEVAFAAGFGSVRQFNDTIREVFAEAPSTLRERATGRLARRNRWAASDPSTSPGALNLRLAYRAPFPSEVLFAFLATRAVPGVEEGDSESYRRTLRLPHGAGVAEVRAVPGESYLRASVRLEDLRDLTMAVKRLRQLFDLDADPSAVSEALGSCDVLGPAVAAIPGLRVPGHVDGAELAIRAVLGQQVSVAGARTLAGRLAVQAGDRLPEALAGLAPTLTHLFPTSGAVASVAPGDLAMPASRAKALIGLAEALASGAVRLEPGADRDATAAQLLELPGIGPWTVEYVKMRALGDPDAFLASDLGVRRALETVGLPGDPRAALALATRWRPFRSYALQYLWARALAADRMTGRPTPKRGQKTEVETEKEQVGCVQRAR